MHSNTMSHSSELLQSLLSINPVHEVLVATHQYNKNCVLWIFTYLSHGEIQIFKDYLTIDFFHALLKIMIILTQI